MEMFPDGAHVRLLSRVRDMFVQADEDGWKVSLTARRHYLNAVWLVHRLMRDGKHYVLFHSAAYGGYLGLLGGLYQGMYTSPTQEDILWEAVELRNGKGEILLRHAEHSWYCLDLTGGEDGNTGRCWAIEAVPATRHAPPLRRRTHES
nr:unnamed protein product [Digitaria exilis]